MRRARLAVLAVLALVLALPAAGQSVAEAAEKERKRRQQQERDRQGKGQDEKGEKPRVYTNQDLEHAGEGGGNVTSLVIEGLPPPRRSAGRGHQGGGCESGEGGEGGEGDGCESDGGSGARPRPHDEKRWRADARDARSAIANAEKRIERAQQSLAAARQDRDVTTDVMNPFREQARQERIAEAQAALDAAEAAREDAQQALQELREQARREAVPPGWLR